MVILGGFYCCLIYKSSEKMKKTKIYTITILSTIVLLLVGYNVTKYINKNTIKNSLNEYLNLIIEKKSQKVQYDYYFFFITSPMDCASCTQFIKSKAFMDSLKNTVEKINKKIFTNFIIFGNLTKEEKLEYVEDIKHETTFKLENRKKIEMLLENFLNTSYTPLVIILDKNKTLKYWRDFRVEGTKYKKPYIKFINSLGDIL